MIDAMDEGVIPEGGPRLFQVLVPCKEHPFQARYEEIRTVEATPASALRWMGTLARASNGSLRFEGWFASPSGRKARHAFLMAGSDGHITLLDLTNRLVIGDTPYPLPEEPGGIPVTQFLRDREPAKTAFPHAVLGEDYRWIEGLRCRRLLMAPRPQPDLGRRFEEVWWSDDLWLPLEERSSDQGTEVAFKLTGVSRTEPAPELFSAPSDFQKVRSIEEYLEWLSRP